MKSATPSGFATMAKASSTSSSESNISSWCSGSAWEESSPVQTMLYLLVGGLGLLTHLFTLLVLTQSLHLNFVPAQLIATFCAMCENFFLNNLITYRDRRFRGLGLLTGGARFLVACSFGAWANIIFARALLQSGADWYLAGLAGIVLGSVWNLSISSVFTWQTRNTPGQQAPARLTRDVEVYR